MRRRCAGVASTWQAKQPGLPGGSANGSDRHNPRALCGLRADACGREACGTAWHPSWPRDDPANGVDLPYRTFDKRQQVNQAAIVENKRLGPVLAYIAEKQKELDMSRSSKAPRRRGQRNHMFKVR